jgi:hypothetical protein
LCRAIPVADDLYSLVLDDDVVKVVLTSVVIRRMAGLAGACCARLASGTRSWLLQNQGRGLFTISAGVVMVMMVAVVQPMTRLLGVRRMRVW